MELWSACFRSKRDLERWSLEHRSVLQFRRRKEAELERALPRGREGVYQGYCWVCGRHSQFTYDWKYAHPGRINWRERLVCRHCGLANRSRLAIHALAQLIDDYPRRRIYLTEHLGALAAELRRRCPELVCSEFLGAHVLGGTMDKRGIRHEDLTRLSFPQAMFDVVLTFDVLEHVPDYRRALREIRRVLKPGGRLLASIPFSPGSEANVARARVGEDGVVEHLLPPEYHGDPVDPERGVLCFHNFGWEILDDLRAAGFSDAIVRSSWSTDFAYIGHEQPLFVATA
jgi:SAM-dependent methyltransferase